jgi:predicted RNA-binding Zn-ribbon protein involved in translation (DUF1610 family)
MITKPRDKDEKYDSKKKNSDEMFCYSCGSIVKIHASTCPKCGVPLKYTPIHRDIAKEKETAVLLSIFTSFFVWAYLYDKNVIKFWIGLTVSIVSIILSKFLFDLKLDQWYLLLIPLLIIWIFAIIDVSMKNREYYKSFGGD